MPNKALLVIAGHVGGECELKTTAKGTPVLKFSLAVNTGYGDKKVCTWWNCTMFGERAEKVAAYVSKRKPLMVDGEPSLNTYTKKDGTQGASIEVIVRDITLLGGGQAQQQTEPAVAQEYDSDASPF